MKAEKLLNQTFFKKKSESKAIKISALCCLPVKKFSITWLLATLFTSYILYGKNVWAAIFIRLLKQMNFHRFDLV